MDLILAVLRFFDVWECDRRGLGVSHFTVRIRDLPSSVPRNVLHRTSSRQKKTAPTAATMKSETTDRSAACCRARAAERAPAGGAVLRRTPSASRRRAPAERLDHDWMQSDLECQCVFGHPPDDRARGIRRCFPCFGLQLGEARFNCHGPRRRPFSSPSQRRRLHRG